MLGVPPAADTPSWTIALPAERSLALETTNGNVRVLGEPRQDAVLEVVPKGPDREARARMPVTICETAAELRMTAVQEGGATDRH